MKNYLSYCLCLLSISLAHPAIANINIGFDDVSSGGVNLTTRYQSLGVRLDSISNPFPLVGIFPSPENLPQTLGDVYSWQFASSPDLGIVAVSTGSAIAGENGILMSFDFDISSLSLQGVDSGFFYGIPAIKDEDEAVTLTAYNELGFKIGNTFSTLNLESPYDITPASISLPNMRYVAFNYTGTGYGFYGLDNLSFTAAVPEPSSGLLLSAGLGLVILMSRKQTATLN